MDGKKPEITYALGRIEDLSEEEMAKVEDLPTDVTQGLVIKEYKSGSFVKLRRLIPKDNLFTGQVDNELNAENRTFLTEEINKRLG